MAVVNQFDINSLPNCEVRHISSAVGKGLFSKRAIKCGEVIFAEKPIVSSQFSWNKIYGYLACNNCLKPLEDAQENVRRLTANPNITLPLLTECCFIDKELIVRCEHCGELYCSLDCKNESLEQSHKFECSFAGSDNNPLFQLEEMWKHIHYPPETCSIMLLVRILATIEQSKDRDTMISTFKQFVHHATNYEEEISHKLLGEKFKAHLEMLRNIMCKIFPDPSLQEFLTPEGFQSLFALIGTNGQGIGTSSFSVWVDFASSFYADGSLEKTNLDKYIDDLYTELDKESGMFLNCEGSGLYSIQSACNHSCDPNAEVSFPHNNSTLVVTAKKDIDEDSEILISYLDECELMRSRHSRIKYLRENYLFTCTCSKCFLECDQEDVTSEEDMLQDEDDD